MPFLDDSSLLDVSQTKIGGETYSLHMILSEVLTYSSVRENTCWVLLGFYFVFYFVFLYIYIQIIRDQISNSPYVFFTFFFFWNQGQNYSSETRSKKPLWNSDMHWNISRRKEIAASHIQTSSTRTSFQCQY